eukprot:15340204-Ditylum_brightwellii.AAC.1
MFDTEPRNPDITVRSIFRLAWNNKGPISAFEMVIKRCLAYLSNHTPSSKMFDMESTNHDITVRSTFSECPDKLRLIHVRRACLGQ